MPKLQHTSRQQLLDHAHRLAAEYGEHLTLRAFRRETGLSAEAVFDAFGTWSNLRRQVGLQPDALRGTKRVSREQIIALMRQQVELHGPNLSATRFIASAPFSMRVVNDRFGCWGNLRLAVGLSTRAVRGRFYTDDDMIRDLYRIWRLARQRPGYNSHIANGGEICPLTIKLRFGSWTNALLKLKEYLRSITPPEENARYPDFTTRQERQFFDLHPRMPPFQHPSPDDNEEWTTPPLTR